jgi:cobalt-zinc-cadmium efflux system protein
MLGHSHGDGGHGHGDHRHAAHAHGLGADAALGTTAGRGAARYRARLSLAFVLVAGFLVVELVAAWWSGSLALLSDAVHMVTDAAALGLALGAIRLAERRDTTGRRTFGHYRTEVLASLAVAALMLVTGGYVVVAAVTRVGADVHVASGPMLLVAVLGLAVNVAGIALLRTGSAASLNVRAAYQEVLADAVGSLGVLVAAVLIGLTGQVWIDTVAALAIGAFIAPRALRLGRDALHVLAQHAPAGVDVDAVAADLAGIQGVTDVHDLHLWSLTSGMDVATVHLVTTAEVDAHAVLDRARDVLRGRHGIAHATLQVEPQTHTGCHEIDW